MARRRSSLLIELEKVRKRLAGLRSISRAEYEALLLTRFQMTGWTEYYEDCDENLRSQRPKKED